MDAVALSSAWHSGRRSFWTKRKKTATSMLAVLALLAGIAVAFKLFDKAIPNNVVRDAGSFSFEVWKFEPLAGDTDFEQAGAPPLVPIYQRTVDNTPTDVIQTYPGDERDVRVKIINTNNPPRDASFFVYVDQIAVFECTAFDADNNCQAMAPVPSNDPRWARFVNFWKLVVDKEKVLTSQPLDTDLLNEDDHGLTNNATNPDRYDDRLRQYTKACEGGIREIRRQSPCNLGMVRAAGSRDVTGDRGPTDVRYYHFRLQEVDDGTDQSAFRAWDLQFSLVFQARLPAIPEGGPLPVGER